MSMNIPFDRVLVPGPYGQQHIQFINVNVPPQLHPYVAHYALTLLNLSFEYTSKGVARRFVNNMLTFNNFNNSSLNELTELAFRMGWHMTVQNQTPGVDHALTVRKACEQALGVTTACLAIQNEPLIRDQPVGGLEQIKRTAAAFQTERANYYRYTFQELGMGNDGRLLSTMPGAGTPAILGAVSNVVPLAAAAAGAQDSSGIPTEWSTGPKPSLSQAAVVNPPTAQATPAGSVEGAAAAASAPPAPVVDFVPTLAKPQVAQVQELLQSVAVPDYNPARYSRNIVTHNGVHEMDASTHSRAYFGNTNVSAESALVGMRSDSFRMAGSLQEPSGSLNRQTLEELKIESNLDSLFMAARANHVNMGLQRQRTPHISRIMGIALNPVFTDRKAEGMQHATYSQDIRKIAVSLKEMIGSKDDSNLSEEQHGRLVTASYIDRTLGRMTNDFIARGLRLRANLTTFADSIADAESFIAKKCPSDYNPLFQVFLTNMAHNLRTYSTPEMIELARSSILGGLSIKPEEAEKIGVVVVPTGHTVTFCNLTQTELEWLMNWNGSDIDPKVTPTLSEICFTLREDKRSFGFNSSYDWLMTGDGETFLVHENPDLRGGYRMFPVNGLNINRITVEAQAQQRR